MIEIQTTLEQVGSDLWEYVFRVENSIAQQFITGDERRVVCTVNGKVRYHAALLHDGLGGFMVLVNQSRRKQLGLHAGDRLTVTLEKDTSEYGMPMSDELREVLDQDSEADALFHRLTPGKQRTLIYWTDNVKNPDIRIRRALVMTAHLVAQRGTVDFKQMNEELKAANRAARRE
jgi:hypothetical protein